MGHVGSSLALERRGTCSAYATHSARQLRSAVFWPKPKARPPAGEALLVCTMDLSPASTWKRAPADHELWRSLIQKDTRWVSASKTPSCWGGDKPGRLLSFPPLPSSKTWALLAWSLMGLHPSSLLGWGFLPCCPSGSSSHLWGKSPVPRISSLSPQSWDYLIALWASLVWLCFPLWSHSVLLEQQVNQHIEEVNLHCRISGNTVYVNVEA